MPKTKEHAAAEAVARPGAYATLLVHGEPNLAASHRVEVAGRLARELGATLIGLGAETVDPAITPDLFTGFAAAEWITLVQQQIGRNIDAAETAFRRDAGGADVEWRSLQDYPSRALVQMARAADLVVCSPRGQGGATRTEDPADVVMGAGRPVLIVPQGRSHLLGNRVVVAWKDTRECRRAITDALPLLQRAETVLILGVGDASQTEELAYETNEVAVSLKRRGVEARATVSEAAPDAVAAEIQRVADASGADLIVCGAFGHSRLREWAFGGVTNEFLHRPQAFVLMTH